ncbi:MAG: trypsin-like peptidase domain-containing protein [Marinifilaceae bacterium]|nr:trypsin-like peptidase domain-containing protein [Marinifilaceae bacterium]
MKILRFIAIALTGFIGGLSAIFLINKTEQGIESVETKVSYQVPATITRTVMSEASPVQQHTYGTTQYVDLRSAAQKTVESVVHIQTMSRGKAYLVNPFEYYFGAAPRIREYPGAQGSGSGVIVTPDGYIVTNNHVIEGSSNIKVVLSNKKEYDATLIGRDPETDIALLKIEADSLQAITFGNSDNIELGEWVLAVGNPYNLTSTVTAGIISATSRPLSDKKMSFETFIQTDAAINPGNSGGALVNMYGDLIGINTAIQSPTGSYSGYSFAIPANVAKRVVEDILQYGASQKAALNISIIELTPAAARQLGIDLKEGIYVAEAIRGGAADLAGIETGDIITKIGNREIREFANLKEELNKARPGDRVDIELYRNGQKIIVTATLKNAYTNN